MMIYIWQILVRFWKSTWIFAWYVDTIRITHPAYQKTQNCVMDPKIAMIHSNSHRKQENNAIWKFEKLVLGEDWAPLILRENPKFITTHPESYCVLGSNYRTPLNSQEFSAVWWPTQHPTGARYAGVEWHQWCFMLEFRANYFPRQSRLTENLEIQVHSASWSSAFSRSTRWQARPRTSFRTLLPTTLRCVSFMSY